MTDEPAATSASMQDREVIPLAVLQYQAEVQRLTDDLARANSLIDRGLFAEIEQLKADLARVTAERDAALEVVEAARRWASGGYDELNANLDLADALARFDAAREGK